jgi:hemerythrin
MSIIWQTSFETGIEVIDQDHKKLVDLLNRLERTVDLADKADIVESAIETLVDYVSEHFEREEKMMKDCGFPQYEGHIALHMEFAERVGALSAANFMGQDRIIARDLLDFLTDWLVVHIQKADQDYVPWMTGQKTP